MAIPVRGARRAFAVVCCLALSSLSGCSCEVPFTASRRCQTQADCPTGASCVDGLCQACPACAAGERCLAAQCLPASCDSETCLPGEACLDGQCVGPACLGIACPDGRCVDGVCWPMLCGAATCSAGFACEDGQCREAACLGKACAAGSFCKGGSCLTCGTSETCDDGVDDDCDGLTDCADPDCESQACGATVGCVSRVCSGGACADAPGGAGTVCRPAADLCDRPESCDGASTSCPVDEVEASGVECRPSAGLCDVAESCDGTSAACPADGFLTAATPCRAAAGVCDVAESCDGTSADCPADGFVPAATPCRAVAGVCDAEESCDGTSADCPTDAKRASGVVCRAAAGDCDAEEACDGASDDCPADAKKSAGAVCRAVAGPCDVEEACDGTGVACPADQLLSSSVLCAASSGICELAAYCDGNSPLCPAKALISGTVCRNAVDVCDLAESCDGAAAACPADEVAPVGTPCGSGSSCTGTATDCPGTSLPTAPVFVSIAPTSPSRTSTTPAVKGLSSANTATVTLYSEAACATSLGSGTKATWEGAGIAATVPANATTTIYAKAFDAASGGSPCAYMTTYVHDDVGPADPVFVATNPEPPAGTAFAVLGLASADTVAVTLYTDASCSTAVGTGSAAAFEGSGVAVSLPANVDTTLYGQAVDAAGNLSGCAALTTYHAVRAWTWVSGGSLVNQLATYGTQGVAAAGNKPGARDQHQLWNRNGTLWVFGGNACNSRCANEMANDLWRFDGTAWTWMKGGSTPNLNGTYGTLGVAAAANTPGARQRASGTQDASGNLWLFGGYGYGASKTGKAGLMNDLWKFDGTNWTWVSGSDCTSVQCLPGRTGSPTAVYGTLGVAATGNVPGARSDPSLWFDSAGRLWMFGGAGCDATTCVIIDNRLADLWMFDPVTRLWTWVAGASSANPAASYGTKGVASGSNVPGPRFFQAAWYASGTVYLFGGYGTDAAGAAGSLSDLWRWDGTNWTWLAGPSAGNQLAAPGTRGVAAASNWPGGRSVTGLGARGANEAWIYGGAGCDSATCSDTVNYLSDLWHWDGATWTWMTGNSLANQSASHGSLGVPATANTPGGRSVLGGALDAGGTYWIFGGTGYDDTGVQGRFNDLWKYE